MKVRPILADALLSKRGIKLVAAAFPLGVAILAFFPIRPSCAQTDQSKNPVEPTEQNLALGLDHYDAHCAACHGRMGKSDTELGNKLKAADLTSKDAQSRSDKELFTIISRGVPGRGMPAFGKTHSPDEIWHMVLFVRRLPTLTGAEREKLESEIPEKARHHHHGAGPDTGHQPQDGHHEMDMSMGADHHQSTQGMEHGEAPENQAGTGGSGPERSDTRQMNTMPGTDQPASQSAPPALTLADLQDMALKSNPTLAQSQSQILAAEGRRKQAGLYPNPLIGYSGQEFAFHGFPDKSEHFFFVEQSIITAGKLKKSQEIFVKEASVAQAEAEAQRMRVLNTVSLLYYEALGAQQTVELRRQMADLMRRAVNTSAQLVNVGQADQPDFIETENEASQSDLKLIQAETDRDEIWRMLAAAVGSPAGLEPAGLKGSLEQIPPAFDEDSILSLILQNSPEIKKARAGVERARAVLARARAERIPDLFVRGQVGYSNEALETLAGSVNGRTGAEASIEVGVRLPLFNRNQGNIAAAEADLTAAENEVKRQELALRARLASAFNVYQEASRSVQEYREKIIPRAQRANELYQARYQEMAAAYPQVIISQRTLLRARLSYTEALVSLQENAVRIQGFLLTGGLDAPNSSGGFGQADTAGYSLGTGASETQAPARSRD